MSRSCFHVRQPSPRLRVRCGRHCRVALFEQLAKQLLKIGLQHLVPLDILRLEWRCLKRLEYVEACEAEGGHHARVEGDLELA